MATDISDNDEPPTHTISEGEEATPQSPSRQNAPLNLQHIDDFMKEHDEQEEQEEVNRQLAATTKAPQIPGKKKSKGVRELVPEVKATEKSAIEEIGTTNWIGKLNQYRDARPIPNGVKFVEMGNDDAYLPRFICKVTIHEAPEQSFGNNVSFPTKKTAKQYAAKKAIDWLIEHKHMPSDNSVKVPRLKQPSPQLTLQKYRSTLSTPSSPSEGSDSPPVPYTTQVPPLCIKLGVSVPRYEIKQHAAGSPLCDIYAIFPNDQDIIGGKVGEVRNTFGKKKAKEECARHVVLFLKDLERKRLASYEDNSQSRKRPLISEEETVRA